MMLGVHPPASAGKNDYVACGWLCRVAVAAIAGEADGRAGAGDVRLTCGAKRQRWLAGLGAWV
jgi:hypothetical protein